jgi:UDP-glucose 4-epimerase
MAGPKGLTLDFLPGLLKDNRFTLEPLTNRCLVMGGCGFLGCNLVERLLTEGYRVCVFDRASTGCKNLLKGKFEFLQGDFLNPADIEKALENIDFVLHLVGTTLPISSNENPVFDVESNVVGTIQLLQACVRHHVKRVVFSSSGGTVYGQPHRLPIHEDDPTNPICSYGVTKLTVEKYLQLIYHLHELDYTILRIANCYGKNQKVTGAQGAIGVFLSHIMQGKPITIWGDGSTTRDYVHVEDVADAFVKALTQRSKYRIFNIGTGVGTSLHELLDKMERVTGIIPRVKYATGRPADVPHNILDPRRAQEYLGWSSKIDCETGLRKTWTWLTGKEAQVVGST